MFGDRIIPICIVGLVATSGAPALAQTPRGPSILAESAWDLGRNIRTLYYDDTFLFAARDYGDGRDAAGSTEPGLFVHSKASDTWIRITAISTADGRFGKSSEAMIVSLGWDFTPFAQRPYVEQPLKANGSLMFPDHIQYDGRTGRYAIRHASRSGIPSAETVLYVLRADLIEAFARAQWTPLRSAGPPAAIAAPFGQRAETATVEFRVVRGDGYEGAIVPAASLWHGMFRIAVTRNRGDLVRVPDDVMPWTPEPADIEIAERDFSAFLTRAGKDPSEVLATLPVEDRDKVQHGLAWLIANVRTLKRQYWGFGTGGARRIAVHGAPDDPAQRWRTEGRAIMDGGCGNFWIDFNLTERRIVRFTCGRSG